MSNRDALSEWLLRERASYVEAFESARAAADDAELTAFLPPRSHPGYLAILCELVRVDLEWRWTRGDRRPLAAYRDDFPELFADPDCLRDAAAEEDRLRQEAGDDPDPSGFAVAAADALPAPDVLTPVPDPAGN